jgi:hypothetical protein
MLRARFAFFAAAGFVVATYAISLAIMPKHVFWSPDEGAKLIQAETIRWNRGIEYEIPYAARSTDPDLLLYPSRCRHNDIYPDPSRGEIRFHWPIWFPLASKAAYRTFGVTGLYLLPLACGWLIAVAGGWLLRRRFPELSGVAVLLIGLASPTFFYSLCFWEHTPASLLGILALGWMARGQPGDLSVWWVAGPLVALSIVLRVEMIAFGAALIGGWSVQLWRFRTNVVSGSDVSRHTPRALAIAAALVAAAVAVFLLVLTPRHWESEALFQGFWIYTLRKAPALLDAAVAILSNSPGHQAPIVAWYWEFLVLCAFLVCIAGAFVRQRAIQALLLLPGLFVVVGFSVVLLSWPQPYISLHGFVPLAPYAALAPYGAMLAWRSRDPGLSLLASTAGLYLLLGFGAIFVFFVRQDGGYLTGLEWGTRNLLTLYPMAAILSLLAWVSWEPPGRWRALERTLAAVLVVTVLLGMSFQVRGAQVLIQSHRLVAEWQAALPTDEPVVTDVWWLPAAMAPFFMQNPMLCATESGILESWLRAAAELEVDTFTFASLDPIRAPQILAVAPDGIERRVSGLYLRRFRITDSATRSHGQS